VQVDTILKRYESLKTTEMDLQTQGQESQVEINREKEILAKFSKRAMTEIVEKNAQMAQMRSDLDQLRSRSKDQTAEAMKRMDEKQARDKDRSSIQMAVDNLYNRCFAENGLNTLNKAKKQDLEAVRGLDEQTRICEMLSRLGIFYLDMKSIAREAKDNPRKPEQVVEETRNKPKKKQSKEITTTKEADDAGTAGSVADGERRNSLKDDGRRGSVRSSEMSTSARGSQGKPQEGWGASGNTDAYN